MHGEEKKKRLRMIQSAALLALLGLSGYAAQGERTQAVGIPVTAVQISEWEQTGAALAQIRDQLKRSRTREIELLDSVMMDPAAQDDLAAQAGEQKLQIIKSMETEARTLAALSCMGYDQLGVVCGGDIISVFAPWQYVSDEQARVKIIAAAAAQAELPPENVKIILAKSE